MKLEGEGCCKDVARFRWSHRYVAPFCRFHAVPVKGDILPIQTGTRLHFYRFHPVLGSTFADSIRYSAVCTDFRPVLGNLYRFQTGTQQFVPIFTAFYGWSCCCGIHLCPHTRLKDDTAAVLAPMSIAPGNGNSTFGFDILRQVRETSVSRTR